MLVETVIMHSPLMLLPSVEVAVIIEVPSETAVTTPVFETVATAILEDNQSSFWIVAFSGEIIADIEVNSPTGDKVTEGGSVMFFIGIEFFDFAKINIQSFVNIKHG